LPLDQIPRAFFNQPSFSAHCNFQGAAALRKVPSTLTELGPVSHYPTCIGMQCYSNLIPFKGFVQLKEWASDSLSFLVEDKKTISFPGCGSMLLFQIIRQTTFNPEGLISIAPDEIRR
jgi:hypothetical protein